MKHSPDYQFKTRSVMFITYGLQHSSVKVCWGGGKLNYHQNCKVSKILGVAPGPPLLLDSVFCSVIHCGRALLLITVVRQDWIPAMADVRAAAEFKVYSFCVVQRHVARKAWHLRPVQPSQWCSRWACMSLNGAQRPWSWVGINLAPSLALGARQEAWRERKSSFSLWDGDVFHSEINILSIFLSLELHQLINPAPP